VPLAPRSRSNAVELSSGGAPTAATSNASNSFNSGTNVGEHEAASPTSVIENEVPDRVVIADDAIVDVPTDPVAEGLALELVFDFVNEVEEDEVEVDVEEEEEQEEDDDIDDDGDGDDAIEHQFVYTRDYIDNYDDVPPDLNIDFKLLAKFGMLGAFGTVLRETNVELKAALGVYCSITARLE
jgi:hypothetical protein